MLQMLIEMNLAKNISGKGSNQISDFCIYQLSLEFIRPFVISLHNQVLFLSLVSWPVGSPGIPEPKLSIVYAA